ncbi:uncharacterized protein BDW70DRAFT_83901 [Aspergillus foveolatus]|uniref:uncharacterized protein n=1 Tax=Aspergillus foveolatus TaxID=210207 RepID=UPI003CCE27BC
MSVVAMHSLRNRHRRALILCNNQYLTLSVFHNYGLYSLLLDIRRDLSAPPISSPPHRLPDVHFIVFSGLCPVSPTLELITYSGLGSKSFWLPPCDVRPLLSLRGGLRVKPESDLIVASHFPLQSPVWPHEFGVVGLFLLLLLQLRPFNFALRMKLSFTG